MRGSGYAIGEILIFLAIAAIIGFLIGWVVFYRRPEKGESQLSAANPNHVRQLETRTKEVESQLSRLERRATALLASLQKTGPAAPAGTGEAGIKPAAAAPEGAGKRDSAQPGTDESTPEAAPAPPGKAADHAASPGASAGSAPEGAGGEQTATDVEGSDDRLAKLEETLNKLSEKLAELDED